MSLTARHKGRDGSGLLSLHNGEKTGIVNFENTLLVINFYIIVSYFYVQYGFCQGPRFLKDEQSTLTFSIGAKL
jgi:hypothetical protein